MLFVSVSNPAAVKYVLQNSEQGPLGVDSPYVDGTFLDDVTGTSKSWVRICLSPVIPSSVLIAAPLFALVRLLAPFLA